MMEFNKGIFAAFALALVILTSTSAPAFMGFFTGVESVKAKDGVVSIAVDEINDGKAHYFSLEDQGTAIQFFVLKSSDGVIRAAFDACDVCYREKKGYSQEGEFMNCNNCGMKFHSSRINEVSGGCNPAPLDRATDGKTLVIKESDILAGSGYFR
ncbi:MAG: Fe-S-containing protein [Desulfovibrio sp.]